MEDRHLARLVLDDLTVNAAKSAASHAVIVLQRRQGRYHATVQDDGAPFRPGTWMRPGGGLERLAALLAAKGGGLALREEHGTKTVTATWQATTRNNEGTHHA